jgi:hypothetical protein
MLQIDIERVYFGSDSAATSTIVNRCAGRYILSVVWKTLAMARVFTRYPSPN